MNKYVSNIFKQVNQKWSNYQQWKKKKSSEDTNIPKKDAVKRFQKENEETKKTIDLEEEKDILKKCFIQEYPLSPQKIDKTIEEKSEKYINMDKYKFFCQVSVKKYNEKSIKISFYCIFIASKWMFLKINDFWKMFENFWFEWVVTS